MSVSDAEVARIKELLGKKKKEERGLILRSLEAFTAWLMRVADWIYNKIRDRVGEFLDRLSRWFN